MGTTAALENRIDALSGHLSTLEQSRKRPYSETVTMAASFLQTLDEFYRLSQIFVGGVMEQSREEGIPPKLSNRFKSMSIADATRILLTEQQVLHGKEIQRLLTEGGIDTSSENFQTTLAIALKRCEGEFEKVGRNQWRLTSTTPPA